MPNPEEQPNADEGWSNISRRAVMRAAAATSTGLPFAGLGAADEDDPADDPLPGPTVAPVGFACDPENRGHYTEVSREPTHDFGEETTLELESERDGEKIMVGVIRPKPLDESQEDGDYPVILRATPYVNDLRGSSLRDCIRTERLTENFVQQGYAVAAVSVRGTGGSGGCMELFGPNEQADVDQAVTHLGEADWSNGNVGIIGRSYDGTTPWMVARRGNPHLATVVPFSGVPDIFDLMYKRGAAETRGYAILPALYYLISLADHSPGSGTGLKTYLTRASCPDNYAQGSVWSTYSGATGDRDPSGYWTERVLKPGVARNYEGSILMVHGLQDWNVDPSQVYPWVNELREAGIDTHIYFGQFSHRYPDDERILETDSYNEHWADYLLAWFESELKGRDVTGEFPNIEGQFDPVPTVRAQNSEGEWYTAEEWPPAAAEPRTLYLGSDGDIRTSPDPTTGEAVVYVDETRPFDPTQPSDPEPGCRSCVTFRSEPFDDDLRFAGEPELNLTVTPTGPGGHLTAYVYAVDEAGDANRLGWGQVDLRFAQDRPSGEPVVPGEELDVNLPLEPLDAVVPARQRLAVVLHQGTVSGRTYSPTPTPVVVETGGDGSFSLRAWNTDLPAETRPEAVGRRDSDASAFTGGQTTHQQITVESTRSVRVRDTVPIEWTVPVDESSDVVRTVDDETVGVTHVYFAGAANGETVFDYYAEAPEGSDQSGPYTLGPVEVRVAGEWIALDGTREDVIVAGATT